MLPYTLSLEESLTALHGKILVGKNWSIVNYSPKFSLPIFTDTPKMYLAYALTVAHHQIFLFYLHGLPKFSHVQYYIW